MGGSMPKHTFFAGNFERVEQARRTQGNYVNKQHKVFKKHLLAQKSSVSQPTSPLDAFFLHVYAPYLRAIQEVGEISTTTSHSISHSQHAVTLMILTLLLLPQLTVSLEQHPENQNLIPQNENGYASLRKAIATNDRDSIEGYLYQKIDIDNELSSLKDKNLNGPVWDPEPMVDYLNSYFLELATASREGDVAKVNKLLQPENSPPFTKEVYDMQLWTFHVAIETGKYPEVIKAFCKHNPDIKLAKGKGFDGKNAYELAKDKPSILVALDDLPASKNTSPVEWHSYIPMLYALPVVGVMQLGKFLTHYLKKKEERDSVENLVKELASVLPDTHFTRIGNGCEITFTANENTFRLTTLNAYLEEKSKAIITKKKLIELTGILERLKLQPQIEDNSIIIPTLDLGIYFDSETRDVEKIKFIGSIRGILEKAKKTKKVISPPQPLPSSSSNPDQIIDKRQQEMLAIEAMLEDAKKLVDDLKIEFKAAKSLTEQEQQKEAPSKFVREILRLEKTIEEYRKELSDLQQKRVNNDSLDNYKKELSAFNAVVRRTFETLQEKLEKLKTDIVKKGKRELNVAQAPPVQPAAVVEEPAPLLQAVVPVVVPPVVEVPSVPNPQKQQIEIVINNSEEAFNNSKKRKGKQPVQKKNSPSFFIKKEEGSSSKKASFPSQLSVEEVRDQALIYVNNVTNCLAQINRDFEDPIEQAIFRNALTYSMARLFVCLWEVSLKANVPFVTEEEQRKWRHFFAHLADKAEINALTDAAYVISSNLGENNNNITPEALLQLFQSCQLNNTALYLGFSQEWNEFRKNKNNNEKIVAFFSASECLDRMKTLAQQFVDISNSPMNEDREAAMKMLLAKIGENAALLKNDHPEVYEKLIFQFDVSYFIKFRNQVFHQIGKEEEADLTDAHMPDFILSLDTLHDEIIKNAVAQYC
jgi:hypothetical protein